MLAKWARLSILHEASEHAAWCHVQADRLEEMGRAYAEGRVVVSPEDFRIMLEAQRRALLRAGNLGLLIATVQPVGRPSLRAWVRYRLGRWRNVL